MKIVISKQLGPEYKKWLAPVLGGYWPNRFIRIHWYDDDGFIEFNTELEQWCKEHFQQKYHYRIHYTSDYENIIIHLESEDDLVLFKLRWK